MTDTYLTPDPVKIKALLDLPLEGPVVMLNLLKFRPNGGAEVYAQYASLAISRRSGRVTSLPG